MRLKPRNTLEGIAIGAVLAVVIIVFELVWQWVRGAL